MTWPVFLFITPPGWAILALFAKKYSRQSIIVESKNLPSQSASTIPSATPSVSCQVDDDIQGIDIDQLLSDEDSSIVTNSALEDYQAWLNGLNAYEQDQDKSEINEPQPKASEDLEPSLNSELDFNWIVAQDVAIQANWKCPQCLHTLPNDFALFNSEAKHRFILVPKSPISASSTNGLPDLKAVHFSCTAYMDWEKACQSPKTTSFQAPSPLPWSPPTTSTVKNSGTQYSSNPRNATPAIRRSRKGLDPRPGVWAKPNAVINAHLKRIDKARMSDEQRERAREFLYANHELDLMKKCQRGHTLTLENTYFRIEDGGRIGRQCRQCRR